MVQIAWSGKPELLIEIQGDRGEYPIIVRSRKIRGELTYWCISHVWGERGSPEGETFVNQSPVQNLDLIMRDPMYRTAFDRLLAHGVKHVWIDVICIKQNDFQSISSQVYIMGDIFHNATGVYICTNPLRSLDELGSHIIGSKWFKRVWTLQEMVLARSFMVPLESGSYSVISPCTLSHAIGRRSEAGDMQTLLLWMRRSDIVTRQELVKAAYYCSISAERICRNEKDRIYAVMGITEQRIRPLEDEDGVKAKVRWFIKLFSSDQIWPLLAAKPTNDPEAPGWMPQNNSKHMGQLAEKQIISTVYPEVVQDGGKSCIKILFPELGGCISQPQVHLPPAFWKDMVIITVTIFLPLLLSVIMAIVATDNAATDGEAQSSQWSTVGVQAGVSCGVWAGLFIINLLFTRRVRPHKLSSIGCDEVIKIPRTAYLLERKKKTGPKRLHKVMELYGHDEDWKHVITMKGAFVGVCNKAIKNDMRILKVAEYRGIYICILIIRTRKQYCKKVGIALVDQWALGDNWDVEDEIIIE